MKVLIILASLFFAAPISANESEIHLKGAKTNYLRGDLLETIQATSQCLNALPNNQNRNLEECLFIGHLAADKLFPILADKYYSECFGVLTPCTPENWEAWMKLEQAGLSFEPDHWGHVEHKLEYLKKLATLFPNSKYGEHFEYRLIKPRRDSLSGPLHWIEELRAYMLKYPEGKHYYQAASDIGHIYHNLWEYSHPDYNTSEPHRQLSHGLSRESDRSKLLEISEGYRVKAIKYYEEVLNNAPKSNPIERKVVGYVQASHKRLINRESGVVYIFSFD